MAAQPKPSLGFFSQEAAAALNIPTVVQSIFQQSALCNGVALRVLRFGAEAEFVPCAECFCNYKYINVYRNGVAEPHHKPTQITPTRTKVVILYLLYGIQFYVSAISILHSCSSVLGQFISLRVLWVAESK